MPCSMPDLRAVSRASLDSDRDGDFGDIAFLDENGRVQGLAWIPGLVELLCCDEPSGRHNFSKHAADPHILYAGLAPHISIRTANLQINFTNRHGPTRRTEQPAPHKVRFGEGVKNQLPRCIEIPGDLNFMIAGCSYVKAVWIEHTCSF